jgi:hypothetical protein
MMATGCGMRRIRRRIWWDSEESESEYGGGGVSFSCRERLEVVEKGRGDERHCGDVWQGQGDCDSAGN